MLAELRVRNLLLIESAELALGPRAERDHRRDRRRQDDARARARPAARGQAAPRHRAARARTRPTSRASSSRRRRSPAIPSWPSSPSASRSTTGELVLARRVVPDGPTRAYMQGRSVSAGELRLVGSRLLAFFGQHEHRKLMLASAQLEILDAFCGAEHLAARASVRGRASRGRARSSASSRSCASGSARASATSTCSSSRSRRSRRVAPERGRGGRARARALAARRGGVAARGRRGGGRGARPGRSGDGGALARMAAARGRARPRGRRRRRARRAGVERSASLTLRAAGRRRASCARYLDALEADPERLAAVEERLDQLGRLKRKHGGTIAAVLEHAERCRAERDRLASAERGHRPARAASSRPRPTALDGAARELHATRARGGGELAERVVARARRAGAARTRRSRSVVSRARR